MKPFMERNGKAISQVSLPRALRGRKCRNCRALVFSTYDFVLVHDPDLVVGRRQRQSEELFRIMTDAYRRLGPPMEMRLTAREMELENQSRVVCLPCREDTIRGDAIPLCPGSGERGIAWIASLRKRCEAEH